MQDGQTREVPIEERAYSMGRSTDCHFRLPESAVSRHHAELKLTPDGLVIKDLGSSNGTWVNRHRLSGAVELAAGDLVAIGSTVMVVRVDGEPAEIDGDYAREFGLPEEDEDEGRPHHGVDSDSEGQTLGAAPQQAPKPAPARAPSQAASAESDESSMVGGMMDDLGLGGDSDGSSFGDFEFDLDDDEDDQPAL